MKELLIGALLLTVLGAVEPAFADEQSDVERGRAMIQAERENAVRSEMQLATDEATRFWPVYKEYRAAAADVMGRYTALIADYINRYDAGDLDDAYANELLTSFFALKQEMLDVKTAYIPRFKEVLSPLRVAQFYHLENKLDADIDAQIAIAVPLIDPN